MVSFLRTLRSARRVGLKEWWRQLQYIGDAKSGTYIGKDQFGNKYFENRNAEEEIPGRHRWVDFSQHYYHNSQVPPEWHSWLQHIRKEAPTEDVVMQNMTPPWQAPWTETLTGTRGSYKSYNTAAPKLYAWEPKVKARE
ncbi:NADH ubiquinone oxidoreductase subunit NDUFA12-domain-containing protein [Mucidula mucida]|nr:NADH ubiquinone oxidoreductase subunit NDUFA12-domain-containing protein [Mucidula mucida]